MIRLAKRLARRILGKELALLDSTLRKAEGDVHYLRNELESARRFKLRSDNQTIEELRIRLRQQQEEIHSLSKAPLIEYKITREVYKKHIVEKLDNPVVNSTVSPHQAGYLLGIQRALRVVEELVV